MGLYRAQFRFDGELPDLDAVRAEAGRRLGSAYGVDSLTSNENTVVGLSMLDPFTRPVLSAILEELGGRRVDTRGNLIASDVPEWAHKPIRNMPWRERMAVRYVWWAWLFGTARRRR